MKQLDLSFFMLLVGCVTSAAQCHTITEGHVDLLSVHFDPGAETLRLMVSEDSQPIPRSGNETTVVCPESMKFTVPQGTPLGMEGRTIWILPQNPYPGVPYVGVSTEALPAGAFATPITIRLMHVEGPGHFLLWQSTGLGQFDLRMDSRNGIDEADQITPPVGGHEHHNWGFTAQGTYRLYFQASAKLRGHSTNITSELSCFSIHVLPLRSFENWVATNWPCECNTNIVAAEADPDGDQAVNAAEYALATDPKAGTSRPELKMEVVAKNGLLQSRLSYTRSKLAPDADVHVYAGPSLDELFWPLTHVIERVSEGVAESVTLQEAIGIEPARQRFYRLGVTIQR